MFDEFLEERKRTIQQTEKQQSPKRRPQSGGSIDIFNTIKEATTAQLDLKSVQAKRKQRNRALFGISNQSQVSSLCELLVCGFMSRFYLRSLEGNTYAWSSVVVGDEGWIGPSRKLLSLS